MDCYSAWAIGVLKLMSCKCRLDLSYLKEFNSKAFAPSTGSLQIAAPNFAAFTIQITSCFRKQFAVARTCARDCTWSALPSFSALLCISACSIHIIRSLLQNNPPEGRTNARNEASIKAHLVASGLPDHSPSLHHWVYFGVTPHQRGLCTLLTKDANDRNDVTSATNATQILFKALSNPIIYFTWNMMYQSKKQPTLINLANFKPKSDHECF